MAASKLTIGSNFSTEPTPQIRWAIVQGWDGPEKVLQQAYKWSDGLHQGITWEDVPIEDLTNARTNRY